MLRLIAGLISNSLTQNPVWADEICNILSSTIHISDKAIRQVVIDLIHSLSAGLS